MPSSFLLRFAIQEKPVYTLAECLRLSDIGSLALEHGLLGDEGNPIEECDDPATRECLTSSLMRAIPETFERDIQWLGKCDVSLIRETICCMEEGLPLSDEFRRSIHFLKSKGYLYLFAQENQLWTVLPKELSAIWQTAMTNNALMEQLDFNQELRDYAVALANLYGAYETEQLAAVWNQHHRNKITPERAEQLLGEMSDFQEDFWLDGDLVISESIFSDSELDELLTQTEDMPFYMPAKSIIAQYAGEGAFDENRPELQRMSAFLKTVVPDDVPRRDDLDMDVVYACKEEWSEKEVANMLLQYKFPLDDADAVETFSRLYQSLFENTRLWALRGDTPAHHTQSTNRRVIPFRLPTIKPPKSRKVSRNAPCPCGSGKKYKNCCGAS
ncbi:MAG: SEC-C domain-containing protein [Oscillospiraceae bacterium]|jgi:hypothetical protein|nr:SEC-C domain-containing protein [Oscillospiraceae bacterium]